MSDPQEPIPTSPSEGAGPPPEPPAQEPAAAPGAPGASDVREEGPAAAESAPAEAPRGPGEAGEGGEASEGEAKGPDGKRRKRRRKKERPGGGGGGGGGGPPSGGRLFVEDQIDRDAEHLAREARSLPSSRIRPLGIMAQEVRRMMASGDPRDGREARRALVLMKSKIAYMAGREQGRERGAFVKVRDVVFRGVDTLVRNHDAPDPHMLRNFLDHLEAFVGYHRYHADDRRRD